MGPYAGVDSNIYLFAYIYYILRSAHTKMLNIGILRFFKRIFSRDDIRIFLLLYIFISVLCLLVVRKIKYEAGGTYGILDLAYFFIG